MSEDKKEQNLLSISQWISITDKNKIIENMRNITLVQEKEIEEIIKERERSLRVIKRHTLRIKKSLRQEAKESQSTAPPQYAKYLIYLFISKRNREALLGDLEEEFHEAVKIFGPRKAQFLYWTHVFRSLLPLILGAAENLIKVIKFFQAAK